MIGQRPDTFTVTILAPVDGDRLPDLREHLRGLRSEASPFRRLPTVHFARLLILDDGNLVRQTRPARMRRAAWILDLVTHLGRPPRPDRLPHPYLLFVATFDRHGRSKDLGPYLDQLHTMGEAADGIWRHCLGYPGSGDRAAFVQFLRERSLRADLVFTGPTVGTARRIRNAVHLREQLSRLAAGTEGLSDAELQRRFRTALASEPPEPIPASPHLAQAPRAGRASAVPTTTPQLPSAPTTQRTVVTSRPDDPVLERDDIQGMVLNGFRGHPVAIHRFLSIRDPAAARRWLAAAADEVTTVTAAEKQPAHALHVAVTSAGLARLDMPPLDLDRFPEEFREGMHGRERILAPDQGTRTWQEPFDRPEQIHLLLLLSATDVDVLDRLDREVVRGIEASGGFERWPEQRGERIAATPDSEGRPRFKEHFGFLDGLSQPTVRGYRPERSGARWAEDALPAGEFVLGYPDIDGEPAGGALPPGLASNGSYLVYRKLEQHVHAFRELTRVVGNGLPGGADQAAAKTMGRWPDGTPVVLSPDRPDPREDRNTFGYGRRDPDGMRCPVGAHVRRANPRDSLVTGVEFARRHRMLRRGIPYGPTLGDGADEDERERGLLFLAIVGDIGRQFEFVQAEWMADGNALGLGREQDVFAASASTVAMTVQGPSPSFVRFPRPVVTCRGGEYFFLPGVRALRTLSRSYSGGQD